MSSIDHLINDIHALINSKTNWFTQEIADDLAGEITKRLLVHYKPREGRPTLRLSQMGDKCPRALWYSIHHPELAEPLHASAMLKYSYGHIVEAQTISLSKAAGHEVTGEQDELVVDGIKGHRDCVIDGCIVDVKSCSTPSFKKFVDGSIKDSDLFGYLDQLDGYLVGSSDDPLVRSKDTAYILAIDKTLGNMVLYEHRLRIALDGSPNINNRIAEVKRIVGQHSPPACNCGTIPDGQSGNIRLDTRASYSPFKQVCFPNLRTFLYSKGPVYLTRVVRVPDVVEITSKPTG
jgi:hypothetical protein